MATSNHTYASPYTNLTYHTPTAVKAVGIDVSQHQGVIDWEAVKADGIDFAFIRGAYRGTTSGAIAVDSRFETNIEGAQSAGIQVGVYIYSQAVTEKEAQEEALFMLHLVSGYKIDLPIVMDYEFDESHAGRLAAADLSAEERTGIVLAFCDAVAEEGYAPMVYGNAHMLENNLNADKIAEKAWIWYANYNDTALISDCDVWQYTESGSVDGISTNVDCDLCFIRLHRLGRL
jgi:GH25 family lysozyme M1 (1,4-beta-N-acetylmuramidase)